MKITFYTNYINHHQVPIADEFYSLFGNDYVFVETEPMPKMRKNLGYPDFSERPYLLRAYENDANEKRSLNLALNSDIVIIGSASEIYIKERLKYNKITFRYNERWFKRNYWSLLSPRAWYFFWHNHIKYRKKNLYMLCASAYAANDVAMIFAYPDKCFKWGYFTELNTINIEKILRVKQNNCLKLFWVGRWIDWKHPEMAIQLAIQLRSKGYDFHIDIAGDGSLKDDILSEIKTNNLSDYITVLGPISNESVMKKMQESNVLLFTSDRNEGWGAVLNEAMSNGCTVVASHEIGSVPFLIENKNNGLVFKSKDINSLVSQVELLITNREMCNQLARNAYETMNKTWSPKNASSNFIDLASSLIIGKTEEIPLGPCSKAVPIDPKTILKAVL